MADKDGPSLAFDAFGKTFTNIEPPSESQIVDLGKLTGK